MARADDQNLVRLLVEHLERCGVRVREESLVASDGIGSSRGGLCTMNERRFAFVDPRAPVPEKIMVLAAALASLDLDDVFLPPLVREAVERVLRERGS